MHNLLDFSFSNLTGILVALVPGLINLGLLFYILFFLPKTRTINVFALVTAAMVLWQVNDAFSRAAVSASQADILDNLMSPGWIFIAPLCLHFAVLYAHVIPEKYLRPFILLTYTPALVFLCIHQSHVYRHTFEYRGKWGWVNNHGEFLIDRIIVQWIAALVFSATVILIVRSIQVRKVNVLRYQTLLIAAGFAVPTFSGIITQVIFPFVLKSPAVPIASSFMTIFSISTVWAMKRHRLFQMKDLISNNDLVEILPVAVVNISQSGAVQYINAHGFRLLGLHEASIKNHLSYQQLFRFPSIAHQLSFDSIWQRVVSGDTVENVEVSVQGATAPIDMLVSATPIINNNKIHGALFNLRDVTELKRTHKRVAESEQLLKKSQQMAHLGSWRYDVATNSLTWSDELFRIHGLTPGAAEATHELFLSFIHPDDRERSHNIVAEAVANQTSFDYYYRIIRADGDIRTLRGYGEIELIEGGKVKSLSGTALDVTLEKEHEEKLERQNNELQKINSELDKFVYSVSHDLRSPLTSILGLVTIAEQESELDVVKTQLTMIEKSVLKLDKFIRDILDYSRNARTEIAPMPVDLEELALETTGFVQSINSKVEISVHAVNTSRLISDRTRLFIVLNNLISNAALYADPTRPDPFVNVLIAVDAQQANIVIQDNGIGIEPENQQRVFDMFFRVSEASRGSGLGLYIVKDAVAKLNGKISMTSELGKGTRFEIVVPNLIDRELQNEIESLTMKSEDHADEFQVM